jgi:uncharacterized protein YyaL (SSP411 family)
MKVQDGFASSLDAETEGGEGKYYTWSEAEIDAALAGTATQRFKMAYAVTRDGNFEGRNILHRLSTQTAFTAADEALFTKQKQMLREARSKRPAPMRDDKVIAESNGMMITALAKAGLCFRRQNWLTAAIKAFDFVEKTLGDGDRLHHSWRAGKRGVTGFSDDYAHMSNAALALWEATGDKRYLRRAQAWANVLNEHFWDMQNGGYFTSADDSDPLIVRPRPVFDNAYPCANGLMGGVLAKLYLATMEQQYRGRSNALADAFSGEVGRAFVSMPSYLNSLDTMINSVQVVIVGQASNPKTQELVGAVVGRCLPTGTFMIVDPQEQLPEGHPAFGKTMQGGVPTAYVCYRMVCAQPITNPVTLSQALQLPIRMTIQQPQVPAGMAVAGTTTAN